LGNSLRERLGVLEALNIGCCVKGYSNVLSLDIVPSKSFTRHEPPALLGTFLEKKLVQEAMHSLIDCDVWVWCVMHFLSRWLFD
jgi:hypothetical protein